MLLILKNRMLIYSIQRFNSRRGVHNIFMVRVFDTRKGGFRVYFLCIFSLYKGSDNSS